MRLPRVVSRLLARSFYLDDDEASVPASVGSPFSSTHVGTTDVQKINANALFGEAVANAWAWLCVDKISSSAALARITFRKGSRKGPLVTAHPWLARLESPNANLSEYDLWEQTYTWMEAAGNAYWFLDRAVTEEYGTAPAISIPHPSQVSVIRDGQVGVSGYLHEVGDKKVKWAAEDVIHFKRFNPYDLALGMSLQVPLSRNLQTEKYAYLYNINFIRNGAVVSGVLQSDQPLGKKQIQELRRQIREFHTGASNVGNPLVLERGVKWVQTGITQRDIEFLSGRKYDREAIMGVFGVPPVLAGVLEHANYSNVEAQRSIFWDDTLAPRQRKVESTLQLRLRQETGEDDLYVVTDNSEVPALQEPVKTKVYRIERYVRTGIYTIDEARLEVGKDPLPNGRGRVTLPELLGKQADGLDRKQVRQLEDRVLLSLEVDHGSLERYVKVNGHGDGTVPALTGPAA